MSLTVSNSKNSETPHAKYIRDCNELAAASEAFRQRIADLERTFFVYDGSALTIVCGACLDEGPKDYVYTSGLTSGCEICQCQI